MWNISIWKFPVLAYAFQMKTNVLILEDFYFLHLTFFARLGVICSGEVKEGIYSLRAGKCCGWSLVRVCYCWYWGFTLIGWCVGIGVRRTWLTSGKENKWTKRTGVEQKLLQLDNLFSERRTWKSCFLNKDLYYQRKPMGVFGVQSHSECCVEK